ncbi:MAG: hypothetical protein KJ749_00410, partial [Planctomycetes bacterium]|nr:hypothetical protein [Planctomycetota bacterium]
MRSTDNLSNLFRKPTRRDLLRWGAACGAAGSLCHFCVADVLAQDVAGPTVLPGPPLEGVARHE